MLFLKGFMLFILLKTSPGEGGAGGGGGALCENAFDEITSNPKLKISPKTYFLLRECFFLFNITG